MRTFATSILVIAVLAGNCLGQPMHDRVMKVDVVELIGKGQEVEGKAEFAAAQGKFTYWFVSEENMMKFLMNEDKYAIQLNGACGRMGPLSGDGTPHLFAYRRIIRPLFPDGANPQSLHHKEPTPVRQRTLERDHFSGMRNTAALNGGTRRLATATPSV